MLKENFEFSIYFHWYFCNKGPLEAIMFSIFQDYYKTIPTYLKYEMFVINNNIIAFIIRDYENVNLISHV